MDNKKIVDMNEEGSQSQLQEKYLQTLDAIEDGCVLQGTVAQIVGDTVFVDVGYKSEGRLSLNDFDNPPNVGDVVSVLVVKKEGRGGQIQLSSKLANEKNTANKLEEAFNIKQPVEGKFVSVIKGKEEDKISGYEISLVGGYKGFCPLSKADVNRIDDPEKLIGLKDYFIVEKFNKNPRLKSVVNRKAVMLAQIEETKRDFFEHIAVGDVVEGTVKSFTSFGVFFDLGGFDGLLHLNDMSWGRISKPKDIFKKGERLRLRVINIDKDAQKINLSLKDMTADPWSNFEDKYHLQQVISGKIVKITDFGAFVEMEPGIEGLSHISELSWTAHVSHPSDLFKVGDEVQAKILGYDIGARRVSLGIRQAQENPWDKLAEKYPIGTRLTRPVVKVTQSGAFINLEEGIDAFLPVDSISWTEKIKDARTVIKQGEEKEVIVTKVDPVMHRIRLSLRDVNDNPWGTLKNNYPKGSIISSEVVQIEENGIKVKVVGDIETVIMKNALQTEDDESGASAIMKYKVGDKVDALVVDINPAQNKLILSVRGAVAKERKMEYEKYMASSSDGEDSYTLLDIFSKKEDN